MSLDYEKESCTMESAFRNSDSIEKGLREELSGDAKTVIERKSSLWIRSIESFVKRIWSLKDICSPRRESTCESDAPEDEEIVIRKLKDAPRGYPRLARAVSSDESFMIYRRFGEVFARLLLNKQDELAKLEEDLQDMDTLDLRKNRASCLMSRELDEVTPLVAGQTETRQQMLERLEKKAIEYSDLVARAQHLAATSRPASRDHRSMINFLENDGRQLFQKEIQYIYEKEDLVTLRPSREHAWLDAVVERALSKFRCKLLEYIFCSKETGRKSEDTHIHYYSRDRIAFFTTLLMTGFILLLLVLPVWLLWRLLVSGIISYSPETVAFLIVFVLLFSAALLTFTKAKRHETLAASAGYEVPRFLHFLRYSPV